MRILIHIISFFALLKYRLFFPKRVKIGNNVIANFRLKIAGKGKVEIGDDVNLWSHAEPTNLLTFSPEAIIKIGKGCRLNGATLQARKAITVGNHCLLGSTIVMDNDFHHVDPNRRFDKSEIPTKPVIIGDNVWLCGQSAVLKGVNIGNNSVVGFRAVVTKDVPTNVVVAGNPALIVREI